MLAGDVLAGDRADVGLKTGTGSARAQPNAAATTVAITPMRSRLKTNESRRIANNEQGAHHTACVNQSCRTAEQFAAESGWLRKLCRTNHTVGFMGDGIHDAPALHSADVGISVDTAVDIAKESADLVRFEQRPFGLLLHAEAT